MSDNIKVTLRSNGTDVSVTNNTPIGVTIRDNQKIGVNLREKTRMQVGLCKQGPPGPQGEIGPVGQASFGESYYSDTNSPTLGDLIRFNGAHWTNSHESNVTDGGNF